MKVSGHPLDQGHVGHFIKPSELVDLVEITPLNRNDLILYNQLLAHAWNTIQDEKIFRIRKSVLRGTHESNDRLNQSYDNIMDAKAKIRYRDKVTGRSKTLRVHLIGANITDDEADGYFTYTFPPELLTILENSEVWAKLASHIMYSLRSKYSIRLYELIERRAGLRKQHEQFSVAQLRDMLGVPKDKLPRFADFNRHCLKPALAEINQLTNYAVQMAPVKDGRAVVSILVTWHPKDPEAIRAAHDERERAREGRAARRSHRLEAIVYD
ncbi:MAG: replication initiation protein [Pseudomonadota bacterium]